jgi:polyketide cyclase/dehydrase/lipid transport protein
MADITDEMVVKAPVGRVWKAIQDPGEHVAWHPFATRIEGEHTLDSVRECSVLLGKKPGRSRERCCDYDEGTTIMWAVEEDSSGFSRMVADWRTGFSLHAQGQDETRVRAHSRFRPRPLVRVMMPVIRRKFHQTQRAILDGLRQHVESG